MKGICPPTTGVQLLHVGPKLHQECQGTENSVETGSSLGTASLSPSIKRGRVEPNPHLTLSPETQKIHAVQLRQIQPQPRLC